MEKGTAKDAKAVEIAESKAEAVQEQTSNKEQKTKQESTYSVNELAANAGKIFKTRQECVAAALKAVGKTECTVTEAKKIVEKFMKREVK